jgi:hypothetical protein
MLYRLLFTLLTFFLLATSARAGSGDLQPAATTDFFERTQAFMSTHVADGRIDYAAVKNDGALSELIAEIGSVDLTPLSGSVRKAYLINAYNLLVIDRAAMNYPLKSVLDLKGFFDRQLHTVGGKQLTLNQLEKDQLLAEFKDARLHFVLVCGALGCPPLTNFAYRPDQLEQQLEQQTKLALNDPTFIRVGPENVALSQIFEWYATDFGQNNQEVIAFINRYRTEALAADAKISYYSYDWSLNQKIGRSPLNELAEESPATTPPGGNNAARYVVSAAMPVGSYEIKIFNNLYSQDDRNERSSFFTSTTSVLYGVANRINLGFDFRYRRVRYDQAGTASNFAVFGSEGATFSRTAVTGFGPKFRIAPFTKLPNFSIQSVYLLPIADDPSGAASQGEGRFVDFDGATWFTQIFNDFPIGTNFSFFGEVDVLLEDIGSREKGRINRFSTPVTGIFSYFPNPKTTLYGLASYSPFWEETYAYFYQLGLGFKYQFTPKFELELLTTAFDNTYLSSVNGNAGTVNFGLRFNL